jgi:hypothetical protein
LVNFQSFMAQGLWRQKESMNMRPALIDNSKGKVHPITDYEGPEGECRYSCTVSLTSALHWGGGVGHGHTLADLPPGMSRYPLYGRLGGS